MFRLTNGDVWAIIGISLLVMIFLVYGAAMLMVKSACLEEGYKEGKVDVFMNRYCIKRVDQTDVVKPLHEVRNESKNEK